MITSSYFSTTPFQRINSQAPDGWKNPISKPHFFSEKT